MARAHAGCRVRRPEPSSACRSPRRGRSARAHRLHVGASDRRPRGDRRDPRRLGRGGGCLDGIRRLIGGADRRHPAGRRRGDRGDGLPHRAGAAGRSPRRADRRRQRRKVGGDVAAEPGLWFLGLWSRPSLIGYTSTQAARLAARIARAIAESQQAQEEQALLADRDPVGHARRAPRSGGRSRRSPPANSTENTLAVGQRGRSAARCNRSRCPVPGPARGLARRTAASSSSPFSSPTLISMDCLVGELVDGGQHVVDVTACGLAPRRMRRARGLAAVADLTGLDEAAACPAPCRTQRPAQERQPLLPAHLVDPSASGSARPGRSHPVKLSRDVRQARGLPDQRRSRMTDDGGTADGANLTGPSAPGDPRTEAQERARPGQGHRDVQPEGRRRQDDVDHQPGRQPRRVRPPGVAGRPRPAGRAVGGPRRAALRAATTPCTTC